MGKLDGKISLITGDSEGIGFAIAQEFLAEGAQHVFITGRHREMLDEAVKKLRSNNVSAIQADASNLADLDKLYASIKSEKGRLDILVANAAVAEDLPLSSVTEEYFDKIYNTNVKGVLFTVQKALLIFSDEGSIILIGSIGSVIGPANRSVYASMKAAIEGEVNIKDTAIRISLEFH